MNNLYKKNIIIGAGISGLQLASFLQSFGEECALLEKSKGVGGRIATRRIDGLGLDHGAPYLAETSALEIKIGPLLHHKNGSYLEGGMNQMAKILAKDLDIHKNQRAKILSKTADGWQIQTEENHTFSCKNLVITAPLPQALELLEGNNLRSAETEHLRANTYKKALIYLGVFEEIPENFKSFQFEGHSFFLMRERRLHPQAVVMHLSDEFSERLFEADDESILQTMREVIHNSPLGYLTLAKDELKKWRYSRPIELYAQSYFKVREGLFLSGDAFTGALYSDNKLVQVLRS